MCLYFDVLSKYESDNLVKSTCIIYISSMDWSEEWERNMLRTFIPSGRLGCISVNSQCSQWSELPQLCTQLNFFRQLVKLRYLLEWPTMGNNMQPEFLSDCLDREFREHLCSWLSRKKVSLTIRCCDTTLRCTENKLILTNAFLNILLGQFRAKLFQFPVRGTTLLIIVMNTY